jgi:hypothetical protein
MNLSIDPASAVVLAMVVGAVVLVFYASRPSVIAKHSTKSTPPGSDGPDVSAETKPRA